MCKAVDGLIAKGEAIGMEKGEERKEFEVIRKRSRLVESGIMTLAQAAAVFDMTEAEFAARAGL